MVFDMTTDKVFRVVMDDQDNDGKQDVTIQQNGKRIVTVYDWKSVVLSWIVSTTALFVAGLGVCTFGL